MSGGADLLGAPIGEPRKRGRPKGSTNKRSADLKGYISAKFGGSAAQQSAALCMVTPAELKRAGGSMAKAQVNKALDLVEHVRQAQDGLDERLREIVRQELRELAADLANGDAVKTLVRGFIHRVKEGSARFGLREALDMIAKERAALLPYTDQRQPLAIEAVGDTFRPSVVVMGGQAGPAPVLIEGAAVEKTEDFRVIEHQVSRSKSHDDGQALELPGLSGSGPAAGE